MATLTLKQVPDELYQSLKERATQNRRSINHEAIDCLERVLGPRRFQVEEWLEEVRALRQKTSGVFVTDELLRRAREEGRP